MLDWLFPVRCPVCMEIVQPKGAMIHPGCSSKLEYVSEPFCKKCGCPISSEEEEFCEDCHGTERWFEEGRGVFYYKGAVGVALRKVKNEGTDEFVRFFAHEMHQSQKEFLKRMQPECIVPVPLHPSKRRRRGFNQAELVAKELGKLLNVPVETDYLIRSEKTTPQKELNRQQRKENLKRAFAVKQVRKAYDRILIIDDIYTTGATIDAISEILKENQSKNVFFLSICVGRND